MYRIWTLLLVTALSLSPVLADRMIDETVPAAPDGEVSIELIAGSVRVIAWDRSEVRVAGRVGDDVEEVEIVPEAGDVSIEVELPDSGEGRRSYNDVDVDLEVWVPRGARIEAEGVSADFEVTGVEGKLEIQSVSGTIEIDGATRAADISTVSGDIRLVSDQPLREGEFETVSGDIEVRAAFAAGGDFSFESVSGDIVVRLPRNASAEFDVETFSGRIKNDFGAQAERDDEYTPAKSLEFAVGGGGARVEIESFSGTIELRGS